MPKRPQIDRQALIALNASPDLGREAICRIALALEDGRVSEERLADRAGRRPDRRQLDKARRLLARAPELAARELERAEALGAGVLTLADDLYPARLRHLHLPPPVLYHRGTLGEAPAVAIVGPRRASQYALDVARSFAEGLARRGVEVVSGFARGVDIAAHRSALSVEGGRTVAVLGCGLGVRYPSGHAREADRIARSGCLVSEFPCHLGPRRHHFPIRNRIIAALCTGVLVAPSPRRSGALITARYAIDLGRDVYAVPTPIFERSGRGSNGLLRDGALLVESADEIIASLPLAEREQLRRPATGGAGALDASLPEGLAGRLLEHLPTHGGLTAEQLCELTGEPVRRVLAALLGLELDGLVRRHPGSTFSRNPCGVREPGVSLPRRGGRAASEMMSPVRWALARGAPAPDEGSGAETRNPDRRRDDL